MHAPRRCLLGSAVCMCVAGFAFSRLNAAGCMCMNDNAAENRLTLNRAILVCLVCISVSNVLFSLLLVGNGLRVSSAFGCKLLIHA